MNDFTKEEWELIKDSIENDYYLSNLSRDFYDPLINKIQSMIDNYCDHEFDYDGTAESSCRKCGRLENDCQDKLKNIFAFLSILFGEDIKLSQTLFDMTPEYLIEKWERYVESNRVEHPWGLHPGLRAGYFDRYFERWCIKND